MSKRQRRAPQARLRVEPRLLWSVFLVVFVVGGLLFGYLLYLGIRNLVAYSELPFALGGPSNPAHRGSSDDGPPASERRLTEPINVLVLGIDRREGEPGPWRTDTMILLGLDPASKTGSMLSIPRDLWVPMPGLNLYERINAAYVYGDWIRYPGGGPAFAKKTVQYNLGIPVDQYLRIDFNGFVRAIDQIGGIDVDVPHEIIDRQYPTPDYGTMRLHIKAGRQHMDGDLALKYVRTRHGASDIDRALRQQQVLMAVREKVLKLKFPLTRIPGLLQILGESVQTDMSIGEIYAVARATQQVEGKDIRQGVIDGRVASDWKTPQGWDVLRPHRARLRALVDELFPASADSPALGPLGDPDRLVQEGARIEVRNGTGVPGLASRMAADLRSVGYSVVRYGDADRSDYPETVIICYADKRYSLSSLQAQLEVADAHVSRRQDPASDVDIQVILGKSAAGG